MAQQAKELKRVLFFLEGLNVPASRFRIEQYQKHLAELGIEITNCYSFPSKYPFYPPPIKQLGLRWPFLALCVAIQCVTRIYQIVRYARSQQAIVLQRDFIYRLTSPLLEKFLFFWTSKQKPRILFDVDDAIFLDSSGEISPKFTSKLKSICSHVDTVIAGNTYLAQYFSKYAAVEIIPTVVDTNLYKQQKTRLPSKEFIVGWTGLASNLPVLKQLELALKEVHKKFPIKVVLISQAGALSPFLDPLFPVEMRAWDKSKELEQLADFDIGIMPLSDDAWSKGKCGFKLIQYLALGIPAVASAVGVNPEILQEGGGYTVNSQEEWQQAIISLLASEQLRMDQGRCGRMRVEQCYSVEAQLIKFYRLL